MAKKHRAYWKGYLRFSLVTIGVQVYNGIESKSEISFRQIHKPPAAGSTTKRSCKALARSRAVTSSRATRSTPTLTSLLSPKRSTTSSSKARRPSTWSSSWTPRRSTTGSLSGPISLLRPIALAGEGFVVIRDALKRTGKLGLAQITIGGREWLVAVAPMGEGLVMEMLRYAEELREPAEFFSEVPGAKPQKEMVDLAVQLIEQKSSPFKPEAYQDHFQDALKALVQQKMMGAKVVAPEVEGRPSGANVVDLMEALKRSVGQPSKVKQAKEPPAEAVTTVKPTSKGKRKA